MYTHDGILGYLDNYELYDYWSLFTHHGLYGDGLLSKPADQTVTLRMTQPLLEANGMLRWAINNVATPMDPPCQPVMRLMAKDSKWWA
jgi:hypothetical protein